MSSGLYTHRTRNAGEIVTDVLYNTAHQNHLQNDIPNQCGALSDDSTAYQATQDPAPGGIVNQVISILEEFQQLRFELADIKTALQDGTPPTQWYTPVNVTAAAVRGRGARVYRNTTQSIASGAETACSFNTVRYDTGVTDPGVDPFFAIGQPTRLTAQAAGLYQINGFVQWNVGAAGAFALRIRRNGTTILSANQWRGDGTVVPWLETSTQYMLAQGDYVELIVFQNASNPFNVINPEFGLELLNPSAVIPPPTQWTLMVTESGTGTGTVTSSPGAINCPGVCSDIFVDGTMVTLTAVAATGGFTHWTGDVPSPPNTSNPIVVTMDQARTVDALFTAYTLNIVEAGTGSGTVVSDIGAINCPGVCSDQYAPGDIVQLTATPTAGLFSEWTGDLVSTTNPDSITMDADKTVTATFSLTGVLLSFAAGGSGALTGTKYLIPSSNMVSNGTIGNAQFKLPIDVYLETLSVTMAAALAGGHTVDFQFNIAGVDNAGIVVNLVATNIEGFDTGSIFVTADTLITIKSVQVGGGGDNIQSLTVRYRPA